MSVEKTGTMSSQASLPEKSVPIVGEKSQTIEGRKQPLNLGQSLDAASVEKGLRELQPLLTFDAVVRRPSDYGFALSTAGDLASQFVGVYYNGKHVCSMDRGSIPEFKLFEEEDGFEEIRMADIERYDNSMVAYVQILPSDPFYHHALSKAQAKDDNYKIENEKLYRYEAVRPTKRLGRCIRLGWRHTFQKLLAFKIPGVTKEALEAKFRVDLSKVLHADPGQRDAILHAE